MTNVEFDGHMQSSTGGGGPHGKVKDQAPHSSTYTPYYDESSLRRPSSPTPAPKTVLASVRGDQQLQSELPTRPVPAYGGCTAATARDVGWHGDCVAFGNSEAMNDWTRKNFLKYGPYFIPTGAAVGVTAKAAIRAAVAAREWRAARVAVTAGTRTFRAGKGADGGGGISLEQAAAAVERNGIDTRMFELRHEPGGGAFGFMSQTGSGALVRGPTGRIILTLKDPGLASEVDALETVAHELNHIRGVLRSGLVTDESRAEAAARAAGRYFRP